MKRHAFLLLAGGLLLAAGVVRAQGPPGGGPAAAPAPPPPPAIGAFAAAGERWAWLHPSGETVELYAGGPGEKGRVIARGAGWTEVAAAGGDVWVLERKGEAGTLYQVPVAGGEPAARVEGLRGAGALRALGDGVYWIESPAPPAGVSPWLAAAMPFAVLRCRTANGEVREVARWCAGRAPGPGDIIGEAGGALFVRVRRPASTEFLRIPAAAGEPARVAGETGEQQAVIHKGELHWTGLSEEATSRMACVRRLDARSGEAVLVSDWLSPSGNLLSVGGDVFYAADSLFRLVSGPRSFVGLGPANWMRIDTDGTHVINLTGPEPATVRLSRS